MQADFQTMALPFLIVMIAAFLVNYTNHFIIRQRAKELATYILLGMDKDKLALVILCELSVIGLACFLLGAALGSGLFLVFRHTFLQDTGSGPILRILIKSALHTFAYFCGIEILSLFLMKRSLYRLQIVQLMRERQRNQPFHADRRPLWGWLLLISFLCYAALLSGIAFLPDESMSVCIFLISIPMLVCVFSFYRWLYALIASLRQSKADAFYQGSRLYQVAELTSGSRTNANVNTIFSICLLFSAGPFVFGTVLLNSKIRIWEPVSQQWMGLLQIGICIVFMIVYFSVLSFLQMTEVKRARKNLRLLFHIGKKKADLKRLIRAQALIRLLIPTLMSFIMLWTAVPFVNSKVNSLLPVHDLPLKAVCGFTACFFALYLCYFTLIVIILDRNILRGLSDR